MAGSTKLPSAKAVSVQFCVNMALSPCRVVLWVLSKTIISAAVCSCGVTIGVPFGVWSVTCKCSASPMYIRVVSKRVDRRACE